MFQPMAVAGAFPIVATSGVPPFYRYRLNPSSPGRYRKAGPFRSISTRRIGTIRNDVKSAARKAGTSETAPLSIFEVNPFANLVEEETEDGKSLKCLLEEIGDVIRSDGGDSTLPRWFSPSDGQPCLPGSPLLLYLPGIDGTGFGLIRHHKRLGKIFDLRCMLIPVMNRAPPTELIEFVESRIRSENQFNSKRPIYIVTETIGTYIALDVAARNPDIDLVLILANPGLPVSDSALQPLITLLEAMPDPLPMLSSNSGDSLEAAMNVAMKQIPFLQMFRKQLDVLSAIPSLLSVLAGVLPKETLIWKLKMLKSASTSANSHLNSVTAQTLILSSGGDQWLSNQEEAERLHKALPRCEIRRYNHNSPFLFLDEDFDLVTVIKKTCFYRHGRTRNYISDYIPPTPSELKKVYDELRWIHMVTSPVLLSTLENGNVVRGLDGIPSTGPVLYVGNHVLLGIELVPMILQILIERNILFRGIAHPVMFERLKKEGKLPPVQDYDVCRLMGAVPVTHINFYKMMSSNSHVLMFPGGIREALHRKDEEHKLFWPERSEFVRMAAKFGAKIVPFGAVGEDDMGELFFDYNEQIKIPYFKSFIEEITSEVPQLRSGDPSELGNQSLYVPGIVPKLPGRYYFCFGKPIETAGREEELRNKEKAHEVYLEVKSEVEHCIEYLKEKRQTDPYRSLLARLPYNATHGFSYHVPTFEI